MGGDGNLERRLNSIHCGKLAIRLLERICLHSDQDWRFVLVHFLLAIYESLITILDNSQLPVQGPSSDASASQHVTMHCKTTQETEK